jgi:hypothetical protein
VGYVQVESNFLGIRNGNNLPVGSGGWVNIIEKYAKAKRYCTDPFEIAFEGKRKITYPIKGEWIGDHNPAYPEAPTRCIDIRCASSTEIVLPEGTLDAVFTDPPYFGMVQYGELMHFCYVWLRKLMGSRCPGLELETTRHLEELTGNKTAERGLAHFAEGLACVYKRMAVALKPGAPLVFTFHHNQQGAYLAAGVAILDAGLTCSASLPCPAEMGGSIHIHGTGSSIVDTVFVCRHRGSTPRAWLFHNANQLAHLMVQELGELQAAGMRPTPGDIRCIAFGHITRVAIWNLRPTWKSGLSTERKLAIFREAMDAIATLDDVKARIQNVTAATPATASDLFAQPETREAIDAVAF